MGRYEQIEKEALQEKRKLWQEKLENSMWLEETRINGGIISVDKIPNPFGIVDFIEELLDELFGKVE